MRKLFTFFILTASSLTVCGQVNNKEATLSLNENAFGPSRKVKAEIIAGWDSVNRYTHYAGLDFIAAVARKEGVEPEQVLAGDLLPLLGIYLGIKGGKGSEFIYAVPGYPALVNAAESVGGVVVGIPLDEGKGNDLRAISAAINDKTQAVYIVNPHNPSGTVANDSLFHAFLHHVSQKTLIIVDEAYLEFSDNFNERTAISNIKAGDNVVVFRTFDKVYGMAGLSFGYAIAPKEVAAFLRSKGVGNVQELNLLSVMAAKTAISDTSYVTGIYRKISEERNKWNALLNSLHIPHTDSQANFVYIDLKRPYAEVMKRFNAAHIKVGRLFPPYNTWVRISIGLPEENARAQQVVKEIASAKP